MGGDSRFNMERGNLFIISAPSGAGKTTLCRRVLKKIPDLVFSISHTTRSPRAGEISGSDYYFVSSEEFDRLVCEGAFIEWARVHDHCYGTSRKEVLYRMEHGLDVLLDIDIQGAREVVSIFADAVTVFILPPSLSELEKRLIGRGTEDIAELQMRLDNARKELRAVEEYEFAVLNDDLDRAVTDFTGIVLAFRNRTVRTLQRPGLAEALQIG
ncbi:MAG TPA: guanylate kinase [Thermodesulfobacteriaceae bacterium]|nr:guanylate kinase [Thermodesulfobacteriaceae bacterium]